MGPVSYDQVNLMLKLYDLRREPRLRQARAWLVNEFNAATLEELLQKYPPGSEESTSLRMATSYWEMCASIVHRGLMDDDLFFENNGEAWVVWEKIKHLAPAWRAQLSNPTFFAHLEELCRRFEAWREKRAPGSNEALRRMFESMRQARARAAS